MGAAKSLKNVVNAVQPALQQRRVGTQDITIAPVGTGGGFPLPNPFAGSGPYRDAVERYPVDKLPMLPKELISYTPGNEPVSGTSPGKVPPQAQQPASGTGPNKGPFVQAILKAQQQQGGQMPQQPPMMPQQGNMPSKGGQMPQQQPPRIFQQPPMMPQQGNMPSKGGSQMPPQQPPMMPQQGNLPSKGGQMPEPPQGQGIQGLLQMLQQQQQTPRRLGKIFRGFR